MFKKLTLALALLCAHNASYSLTIQETNELHKNKVVAEKYETLGFVCFSTGIICAALGKVVSPFVPVKDFNPFYAGTSALFGMSVLCVYNSLKAKRKNYPLREKAKKEAERAREEDLKIQKMLAERSLRKNAPVPVQIGVDFAPHLFTGRL